MLPDSIAATRPHRCAGRRHRDQVHPATSLPENLERRVVVWSAKLLTEPGNDLRAGWIMRISPLPDYARVKDGKVISGGHFNSDWKFTGEKGMGCRHGR